MKGKIIFKGGSGSGHHGHSGRPGKHGGSLPGAGSGGADSNKATKFTLDGVDKTSFAAALGDIVDRMDKAAINPGDFVSEINKKFPPGKRDSRTAADVISIAKKYVR